MTSYKTCKKCTCKINELNLVRCILCDGTFDRKCAKELCDAAGEGAIRPTRLIEWSCTDCQMLTEAPILASASWVDDKVFAMEYARFPSLWKPKATKRDRQEAYASLGAALGVGAGDSARLQQRCRLFALQYRTALRRLAYRHPRAADVLRYAPVWMRDAERRLNWLPTILKSMWIPEQPTNVLLEMARCVRASSRPGARVRTSRALRAVAQRLACPAHSLMDIWSQTVRVALLRLQMLALVGDAPQPDQPPPLSAHEWLAADATLLHSEQRAEWLLGYLNSAAWLLHVLLRLVQRFQLEDTSPALPTLRARWVSAYKHYTSIGMVSSVIVLQRRWWELKMETHITMRMRARGETKRVLRPHHALIARRYPYVVTKPVPGWGELRKKNLIVDITEEQVNEFDDLVQPLPVAADDLILQESKNFETPDEPIIIKAVKQEADPKAQQVVAQLKRDVEELKNFDDMQNLSLGPLIQEYEADLSQIASEQDKNKVSSLSTLQEIDPKISSTSIIFESDSDEETEKSKVANESEDDCKEVPWNMETCELSDDSDVVFKTKKSNVALCFTVSNDTKVMKENETKEIEIEMSVDATEAKLMMVPGVSSVKAEEPLHTHQDAAGTLQDDSINVTKGSEEVEAKEHIEECEMPLLTGSNQPQDASSSQETRSQQDVAFKVPLPVAHRNDKKESSKGLQPPRKVTRWYRGSLKGRLDDLMLLCSPVSVTLEKLPEEILNNVKSRRLSRPVWLPDIEQVRRHNRQLRVAQVKPLSHDAAPTAPPPQSKPNSRTTRWDPLFLEDYGLLTQLPSSEDSDDQISEEQIETVLRDEQSAPLSVRAGQTCCLARRHRAHNDAKRRHAARLGRGDHYVDLDVHGARHGDNCDCCCRFLLLQSSPQSLGALQRNLTKSLEELLKRRGEITPDSTARDQLKRIMEVRSSSSDDERLVIDVAKKSKKPRRKKKKQRKSSVDTLENIYADISEGNSTKNGQQPNENDNDDEGERQKKRDYNEWMRQKNSHRRFFQPPGTKDKIVYLCKDKNKVVTKETRLTPRPDLLDHTYANKPKGPTQAIDTETEIVKFVAHLPDAKINPATSDPSKQLNSQDSAKKNTAILATNFNTTLNSTPIAIKPDQPQNQANFIKKQEVAKLDPADDVQIVEKTLQSLSQNPDPNPDQSNAIANPPVIMPQFFNNPVQNNLTTNYFMIYQPPSTSLKTDQPALSMAIVPISITVQQPQLVPVPQTASNNQASTNKKTIFQENFRQKMVQNLTLLSGADVEVTDEVKNSENSEGKSVAKSPNIFDEVPSQPGNLTGTIINVDESPLVFPTVAPDVTSMAPSVSLVAPSVSLVAPSVTLVAPNSQEPVCMPTISNVTSLAQTSVNLIDDDEDDDCVITSPPVPNKNATKTDMVSVRTKGRPWAPPSEALSALYASAPPAHISRYMRRDSAPFALLRLDAARAAWVLPGGVLVLTDTAVACSHIRYFIINSEEFNRPVPVHFDPPPAPAADTPAIAALPPAPGRIKVRSFAKMPADDAAEGESRPNETTNLDDMLTGDNKLYKRLSNDPPMYGRVLSALTDVISARLLATNGFSLHVYSPRTDSLRTVTALQRERALHCEDRRSAGHMAVAFNEDMEPSEKQWRVLETLDAT